MNLLAEADSPLSRRALIFLVVLAAATLMTLYTLAKARRMSDFLDALSDERLPPRAKLAAFLDIWRSQRR